MIRMGFLAAAVLLAACLPAQADIVISVPDIEIPYTDGSAGFFVTAEFTGSHQVLAYSLDLGLAPRGGAVGVVFGGAAEAGSNYIFPDNVGWVSATDTDFEIAGDDSASSDAETIADTSKYLIYVSLNASLTDANIGDVYDVNFLDIGGMSAVYDQDWNLVDNVTWHPGTITIVPEPSTFVLCGIATLTLFAFNWRRKRRNP